MKEYIKVTDFNEIAELKMANECYIFSDNKYKKCSNKAIILKANYYKINPETFKKGELIAVRNTHEELWYYRVFKFHDANKRYSYEVGSSIKHPETISCKYARNITEEEWEILKGCN